jgi:hypothetical protein
MAGKPKQFLLEGPVDAALEALLQAARTEGNRVSRSDVVGALIWQARGTDGDALGVIIRSYRRELRSAGAGHEGEQPARPGPRPYSGSSGA